MILRTLDEEEAGGGNDPFIEESPSPPKTHGPRRRTVGKTVAAARRNSALCLALCASAASLVWIITREDGALLSGSESLGPGANHHFGKQNKNSRGIGVDKTIGSIGRQEAPTPSTLADEERAPKHARAAPERTGASKVGTIPGRPAIDPIHDALDIADIHASFAEKPREDHADIGGGGDLQASQAIPAYRPRGWAGAASPVDIREAAPVRGPWVEGKVDRAARFGLETESIALPRAMTHPGNTADDMERVKGDTLLVEEADLEEEDWGQLLENIAAREWDFKVIDSTRKKRPIDGGRMQAGVGGGWQRRGHASEWSRHAGGGADPEEKPGQVTPGGAGRDRVVRVGSGKPRPSGGKKAVRDKSPPSLSSPAGRPEGAEEVEGGGGKGGVAAKENAVPKPEGAPGEASEGEQRARQGGDERGAETEREAKTPALNDAATAAAVALAPNREAQQAGDARGRRQQPEGGGDPTLNEENPALIEAAAELLTMMTAAKEKKQRAEPAETKEPTRQATPAHAGQEKERTPLENEAAAAPTPTRGTGGAKETQGEGELREPESGEKVSEDRPEGGGLIAGELLDKAVEERAQGVVKRETAPLPPPPEDEGVVAPSGVGERSGKGSSDGRDAEGGDGDVRPAEEVRPPQENEPPTVKRKKRHAGDKQSAPEGGRGTSTPPKRESPDVDAKRSAVNPPARHADRWEEARGNRKGEKPPTAELAAQPVHEAEGPHRDGEGAASPGEQGAGGGGKAGAAVPCRLEGRVEHWEPPATADLRSSYRWKDAQKASIDRIRRFNLGGVALRDLIHQEVIGLDILRHDLFC